MIDAKKRKLVDAVAPHIAADRNLRMQCAHDDADAIERHIAVDETIARFFDEAGDAVGIAAEILEPVEDRAFATRKLRKWLQLCGWIRGCCHLCLDLDAAIRNLRVRRDLSQVAENCCKTINKSLNVIKYAECSRVG